MDINANKIIDALGGTAATARLCGIKSPSVSEWRHNGIPRPWIKFFQVERPDIFSEPKRARKAA
jgi:hypothetical protein